MTAGVGTPTQRVAAEWRPIPGFEERYEVSSDGRVRSIARVVTCRNGAPKTFKAQEKKQHMCKGYPHVVLYDDAGVRINRYVHVLVCAAFHGPKPTEAHQVRHINGVRITLFLNAKTNPVYTVITANSYHIF